MWCVCGAQFDNGRFQTCLLLLMLLHFTPYTLFLHLTKMPLYNTSFSLHTKFPFWNSFVVFPALYSAGFFFSVFGSSHSVYFYCFIHYHLSFLARAVPLLSYLSLHLNQCLCFVFLFKKIIVFYTQSNLQKLVFVLGVHVEQQTFNISLI